MSMGHYPEVRSIIKDLYGSSTLGSALSASGRPSAVLESLKGILGLEDVSREISDGVREV